MSYRPYEPEQEMLLPASLQDWLPKGHLAYFISDTVDALDLKAFYARYAPKPLGQAADWLASREQLWNARLDALGRHLYHREQVAAGKTEAKRMKARDVVHDTIVVERRYPSSPAAVFEAFADAEQRARWHFPGSDWELAEFEQDFRVGGHERSTFGPKGAPDLHDEGLVLDIVENEPLVRVGTMHQQGVRISMTLCTVELFADGGGTRLKLTDQSAFLDGREKPQERRNGWGKILERLGQFLDGTAPEKTAAS